MPTRIDQTSAWLDAQDALIAHLASATDILGGAPFDEDPSSLYQRSRAEIARIQWEISRLALARLRQIDDAIAAGTLVKDLTALAARAKKEAERINRATKSLEQVTAAVNGVVGVVDQITGLPFL
jgi:hypothetical protein